MGGPWVLRAGGSGPTARLRKGTLAKGTLSRLGRAGVFEGNIMKGTNLTRPGRNIPMLKVRPGHAVRPADNMGQRLGRGQTAPI